MAQAVDDSLCIAGCPPGLAIELTRALKTGQTTSPAILAACNVPYSAAVEISRQVNARSGNSSLLSNNGIAPALAGIMATQITNGPA